MDRQERGQFASWPDYLRSFYNQKFAFTWSDLIKKTFLEKDVYEEEKDVYEESFTKIQALLPYCPPEKYLVHGDFGFDNLLLDRQRVTAVLDWAEMRFGDFLYDVAYLDFWSKKIPYGDLWKISCETDGRPVPHFEERMVCYMLHIGLSSLATAAMTKDERAYIRARERMRSVLKPGRRSVTDWTQ